MKIFKRALCFLLAATMLFALAACNIGGDTTGDTTGTTGPSGDNGKVTYTVTVKTNAGMAMEGLNVFLYADAALTDMKGAAGTDASGKATFNLAEGNYYVQLQGVATGFDVKESYAMNGTSLNITLTSSLVEGEDVTSHTFKVGDVMYNFTYEDNSRMICTECNTINNNYVILEDGSFISRKNCENCEAAMDWENPTFPTVTLSEVLEGKDLVVLNFWYSTCNPCVSEFPVLNEAYGMFAENAAVLGLNSYAPDTVGNVMSFETQYSMELDFPLGKVNNSFNNQSFIDPKTGSASQGYPTSVFVDRYGVICAIEVGSMTSLTQWASVFDHFVGDDYKQVLVKGLDELIERMLPQFEQPTVEEIAAAIQSGEFNVNYHGDEEDVYAWPFVVTEKDGRTCLKASNQRIYESYAILYADIELKAGEVVAFDYLVSCESGGDYLHVIVEGEAIYSITGVKDDWQKAYCWVAPADGTYSIALCYIKDTDTDNGDDTVYIDNLRVVTVEDIDTPSYIPHQAAVEQADGSFEYATIVYNEADGYYHVGSVDGPLLLANLMTYTQLVEDNFLYALALEGEFVVDGHNYLEEFTPFCTVASNSQLYGYCTVTKELAEILKVIAQIKGFDGHPDEWLKVCKYYMAYGTNGEQLEDPCAGLSWFSAYEAVLGNGYVDADGNGQNFFYYDGRPIMPRGLRARFVPAVSGAYRITSHTDYTDGLDAWIFDRDGNMIYQHDGGEMLHYLYADEKNVTMVIYMEAGKDYYIDIAMYDVYGVGYITYDIEYLGESYDLFTSCSPGPFTWDLVSEKTICYYVDVVLGPDGYYYEDLGLDANGNQRYGSMIYAYFLGGTAVFSQAVYPTMLDLGGFDFSKSESDLEILAYLKKFDGDVEATDAYLHELWGADYEELAEIYKLEDVYAGIYHGEGEDYTEEVRAYVAKIIQNNPSVELNGCVPVDARLAELLQMLMDKYTFDGVEYSWQKLCYYYQHIGPNE